MIRRNFSNYEKNFSQDAVMATKNSKLAVLSLCFIVTICIYTLKLYSLQIVKGREYRDQSTKISSTVTTIPAQRGEIFDRHADMPLVINSESFSVSITPGEIPEGMYDTVILKLANFLGVTKSSIDMKIPSNLRRSYSTIEIKGNVSFETISNIAENITDLPGVSWGSKPVRNYSISGSMSHILGYVGKITNEELKLMYNYGYTSNSIIGKTGIERQYDNLLQGTPGTESRTIDARGRILSEIPKVVPPKSGNTIILTIDNTIQALAEKALGNRVGAVVVLQPATGEVLAMVSYPYFDANLFSQDNYAVEYEKLANDPNKPLLNRAVNAAYPPASTFKTIMATAMLNEKVYPSLKKIECEGEMEYGGRVFHCHVKKPGHGYLDLKNALAQSCDVYFWIIGRDYLGVDRISSYAKEFGYGESLEFDLPAQAKGFVPTAQWKERRFHERWAGGDTLNMSIGQGFTEVTPMHVANMMAMVCNSGKIYKPHLLKEVRDGATNEIIMINEPEILHSSTVTPEVWKEVQEGLRYTITDGTPAYPMHNKVVQLAGKTGTAEVNGYGKDHWHSWMVAYGPYNAAPEKQIVIATIVEAVNTWEWWAPYATNIIFQGIFANQTYEEAVESLGFKYLLKMYGRME